MCWACRNCYLPYTEQNHREKDGAASALAVFILRVSEQ